MRNWIRNAAVAARAKLARKTFFHLHLVSDSTGETLITAGRAVAAQYAKWQAIEHVTPMVRTREQLDRAMAAVDREPGIVLYTLVDPEFADAMRTTCRELGVPCVDVLSPVTRMFDSYLGDAASGEMGAQHTLDETYFRRLEAIRFAMAHDDGNIPDNIEEADIILIGISRTSKTPTSIHLAQRGLRCTNVPLVPNVSLPEAVMRARRPLVVALVASAERIRQVRENRLLAFDRDLTNDPYVDRAGIAAELAWTRRLCNENGWPVIDVSRRSVEETAAAVVALARDRDLTPFDLPAEPPADRPAARPAEPPANNPPDAESA